MGLGQSPLRTGRPVGGDHQIENGTGNAHRTGGVLSLTYRQVDRQLDTILEPALGAALRWLLRFLTMPFIP